MTYEEILKAYKNLSSGYGAGVVGDLNTATLELLKEQKAEIERLTEELEKTKENRNGWRNRAWKDEKENAELQKQVGELTVANKQYFNENKRLNDSFNLCQIRLEEQIKETYDYIHQCDNLKKAKSKAFQHSIDEYCRGFEEGKQQAAKDTAKEIYSEINSCIEKGQEYCGLDWRGLLTAKTLILVYCKKKGVEVE